MQGFSTRAILLAASTLLVSCTADRSTRLTDDAPDDSTASSATILADTPAYVVVSPSSVSAMSIGGSVTITGTVYNSVGKALPRTMHWSSADSLIASVTSTGIYTGIIRARAAGSVVITATGGGISTTLTIVVSPALLPVKTVVVTLPASTLAVGLTTQATATALDSLGRVVNGQTIVWLSTNPAVATVSASGLVTAIATGTSFIRATASSVTGGASVTVVTLPVKTVAVTLAAATLTVGATTQATAIATDSLNRVVSGQTFVWLSTSPAVATVSASGLVTAIAVGTSSVRATTGGVSGSATVTVAAPPPPTSQETFATLPQVLLNTTMPVAPSSGGKIISVAAGGSFQGALNSAQPGDVIELANGATFVGNFVLPNKNTTSTNWIVIRPSNSAGLPAEGSRMTPSIAAAARLPMLLSPTNQGAINTALGAHHWRIVGLEISVTPTNTWNTGLVRFGDGSGGGQTTLALVAHDLVLDRSYVHGSTTQNVRRGIGLNSASSSIIDSYISELHETGGDAQAIAGWNGPGPYKIVNNYLEASTENIQWGGSDPEIPNLVPSDIEVRHNHFFKQVSWKGKWLVKNLYESKTSKRSLIEGNFFENNWQDGQNGSAIALKSTNQDGGCTWCGTQDVTFRYNLIRNTGAGFNLSASPDPYPAVPMQRVTIYDNVIANINVGPSFDGVGIGFMINQNPIDLTLFHNTLIAPTNNAIAFGGPTQTPPVRLSFRDNIIGGGLYGVKGSGLTAGTPTISTFMAVTSFVGNVVILTTSANYPAANFYPTSVAAVGFTNAAALDFQLATTSAFRSKATDGRDPGANVFAVLAAIAGVIVP